MREGPIYCILARKDGEGDWGLVLVQPGAGRLARVTADQADALAEELTRMAELARAPGSVPA